MTARETPFALVFGEIAPARFPAIAAALRDRGESAADRDAFVLLEPVARLLGDLVPDDVSPDEMEAHLHLLHHAFRHWGAGGRVYAIGDPTLDRATRGGPLAGRWAGEAAYLQMPSGRVWRPSPGPADAGLPPEPLDGVFVTTTAEPATVAVLGVFGMHRNRPGFSAVAAEGRIDETDAAAGEIAVSARRADGTAPFAPLFEGGAAAGLYSVATAGELLLLTARLLALLPTGEAGKGKGETLEHVVDV